METTTITGFLNIDQELLSIARGDGSENLSDEEVLLFAKDLANRIEKRFETYILETLSEDAYRKFLELSKTKESQKDILNFLRTEILEFDLAAQKIVKDFISKFRE